MRLCQGFAFYLVDIKYLRADKLTILVPNKLSVFIAISQEKLVLNKFRSVAKEFQILSQSVKWETWNVQTGWLWIFQMKDLLPFKYLNFLSIAVNSSKTNFYVINRKKLKIRMQCLCSLNPVEYSGPTQRSNMELFAKIIDCIKPLTIFAKNSTLDVWLGSECASEIHYKLNQSEREGEMLHSLDS